MRSINSVQNQPESQNHQQPTQVFYTNVGGNIQQVSGIKNGNKSIKLLMNMQNNQAATNNTSLNIIQTPKQLESGEVKTKEAVQSVGESKEAGPTPTMNGDNTLLKALLQTAPKNASNFNASGQTVQANNVPSEKVIVEQKVIPMMVGQDLATGQLNVIKQESGTEINSISGVVGGETKKKAKSVSKQVKQQGMAIGDIKATKNGGQAKVGVMKLNEGMLVQFLISHFR